MKEFQPRELAEQFLNTQRQNLVIPPDDINLGREDFRRRVDRLQSSDACEEYLRSLEEILKQAPISKFFLQHLLYEARLEFSVGWTSESEVNKMNHELLGISIEEQKCGIFDPQSAPSVEKRYFCLVLPLIRGKEKAGIPSPVPLKKWASHLGL